MVFMIFMGVKEQNMGLTPQAARRMASVHPLNVEPIYIFLKRFFENEQQNINP